MQVIEIVEKERGGKRQAVDTIQNAAVTRQHPARVLDAVCPLDERLNKVSDLAADRHHRCDPQGLTRREGGKEHEFACKAGKQGSEQAAQGPFHGLLGTQEGRQFSFAQSRPGEEGGHIPHVGDDEDEEDPGLPVLQVP